MDKLWMVNQWPWWIQREILQRLQLEHWHQWPQLSKSQVNYLKKIIGLYEKNIPLTKIIGIKYFYDYKLINHNTLDPRYDSEVIFDIFDHWDSLGYKPSTVVELGGGSGCLSIAVTKRYDNTMVIGELNEDTMVTLKRNLKINGTKATVVKTNWWSCLHGFWDVLITNPPYLSLEEMINGHGPNTFGDPPMALYGGLDGLGDYRIILKDAHQFIGQWIILEICSHKLPAILEIIPPIWQSKIFYDMQQRPRMLLLRRL